MSGDRYITNITINNDNNMTSTAAVINHTAHAENVHYEGQVNGGFVSDDKPVKGEGTQVVENKERNTKDEGHTKSKPISEEKRENSVSLIPQDQVTEKPSQTVVRPQVYRRRWLMLSLFCLYSFSNAFQWIHLNIIADVLSRYYNESLPTDSFQRNNAIDWLSMVYMLAYIPLIFPATWLLDRKGLKICCLLGSLLNAIGAWIKCASVSSDRFAVLMFAQTLCAIAQIWVLGIPPRLAAVWFGANEVSTATSLGVFGNQVGVAVGFLLPPILVPDSPDLDSLATDFSIMFYGTAALTTLIFILIIIFFKEKPPNPPSRAQQLAVEAAANENYLQSLLRLVKNKGFILLMIAYGMNTGSFYAISTLLNPILLHYFPDANKKAGEIGLTIVLMGVLGSVLAGIWLDKTKTFKATTTVIYILSLAGMVAFTFTLDLNMIWIAFVTAGSLGFFMTGYLPVGFEFAAELTFPESEGTSSGLLNASAQTFGIALTLGMRAMIESVSVLGANITICGCLFVGGILTGIIKPIYKRQEAGKHVVEEFFNSPPVVVVGEPGGEKSK